MTGCQRRCVRRQIRGFGIHVNSQYLQRLAEAIAVPRKHRNRKQQLILDQSHEIHLLISHQKRIEIFWKLARHLIGPDQSQTKRDIDLDLDPPETALTRHAQTREDPPDHKVTAIPSALEAQLVNCPSLPILHAAEKGRRQPRKLA